MSIFRGLGRDKWGRTPRGQSVKAFEVSGNPGAAAETRRRALGRRGAGLLGGVVWLVLSAVFATGCSKEGVASGSVTATAVSPLPPVRMVVMVDQTKSMAEFWAEVFTIEHLRAIVAVVRERGGDLLFLVIRGDSARTPGPSLHVDPPTAGPVKPATSDDVFDAADAAERHRRDVASHAEKDRKRLEAAEVEIAQFLADVDRLLREKPDRVATDVGQARARAIRFFEDPDLPGQVPADRMLLAVSDGEDTAGLVAVKKLPEIVIVLLVTPKGPGVFAVDKPVIFSSIPAAIRFVKQGGK